ncbi:MAG: DNA-processing protein DprA [Eubacterium sp.]|nr:DNA-processing protein DprA [Eubacterium sp.]
MTYDEKKDIWCYESGDERFPEKLKYIPDPPKRIYVKGSLPDEDKPAVAIVGARNCTPYGRDMARVFSFRLARSGVSIISGMALGIDGWSHQGALEAGGRTYAVLGSGVDICAPVTHQKLYNSILNRGGIISEQKPGTGPFPANFPKRNRIISGLSDAILVVEAGMKSGSLITADFALAQGKDVFVIPGRIGDELSAGCNRLINQGAIPVMTPEDILERLGLESKPSQIQALSDEEYSVYEKITSEPISLSALAASLQGSYANTQRIVRKLINNRYIVEYGKNRYVRSI